MGLGFVALGVGGLSMGSDDASKKKLTSILHGVGLLLALVGGFGLAAKLKLSVASPWLIYKILVWVALGGFIAIAKRKPELVTKAQLALIVLASVAAYFGVFHYELWPQGPA
jgi:uncharacterized membrane protein SirB2